MDRFRAMIGGLVSIGGAVASSLCCVLPLAIVLLGLGSGAFMATTMKYTALFVPVGVLSVTAGFHLHFRQSRRCRREGCPMGGGRWNLATLSLSALLVAPAVFFTVFPEASANLLMWATSRQAGEVIQAATLAVKFGLRVQDLVETLHPYLTMVEGLKLAALTFEKDVSRLSCCAA